MLDTVDVSAYVFLNMGVCACGIVVLVIPLIRQLRVADSDGLLVGGASAKDSKVKNMDSTIAVGGNILLYIGVLSCGSERLSTPCIWQLIATDSDTLVLGDCGRQDS